MDELSTQVVRLRTDRGVRIGRLLSSGKSSQVYLPSSGSVVSVDPQNILPPEPDDLRSFIQQEEMGRRLRSVDQALTSDPGLFLVDSLLEVARARGYQHCVAGGLHKVSALHGPRAVYLSRNGRTIHLAGYRIDHPLISPLDPSTARERRLGRVRGFASDIPADELGGLWAACLDRLD